MASATANSRERIETVTTEKVVSYKDVTLRLSEDEAQLLVDLLYIVGGSHTLSRRKHAHEIARAMRMTGLTPATRYDINGSVYIEDTEKGNG